MQKSLPAPFPRGMNVSRDSNPAIRLFGKRFIVDQTVPEFLVEFLLVVQSEKRIGDMYKRIVSPLPSFEQIRNWPDSARLVYRPEVKLNLKLFSFLSSSRIDSRHEIHREQYEWIWRELKSRTHTTRDDTEDVVEWLEELLRAFRGAGFNRTWCAQSFFPVASSLLSPEVMWNETVVKRKPVHTWRDSLECFSTYYSLFRYNFLARGGEVLYLQLCNVFTQEQNEVYEFARHFRMSEDEKNLEMLHSDLQVGLSSLYGQQDEVLNKLVDFIESIDPDTVESISNRSLEFACEWCPADSWKEGYLFAVELKRLTLTALDPVEKLELLTTGCALQVLRSLCAQSVRNTRIHVGAGLGYSWIFTPTSNASRHLQLTSQRNLQAVLGLIQQALRTGGLVDGENQEEHDKILKAADDKYGYKLFRALGKKLGIIVPYQGPGARFVMTDGLLRYFILTLLEPGHSCSYEDFLDRLYDNYGIAIEGEHLRDGMKWTNLPPNLSTEYDDSSWLREMLRAGGFLTELSDGYSIVTNTFEMVQTRGSIGQ